MTQDPERIRKLVAFRAKTEKRVEKLDAELKETQALLETLDLILLEKGFKHVQIPKQPTQTEASSLKEKPSEEEELEPAIQQPLREPENVIVLKTTAGEILATVWIGESSLRVVPAQDKHFDVNMPPFNQFLIERVLMKMQERDSELVRTGQLNPDRILSYNIVRDGDIIREISVKNVDAERLRELRSSIRWTLEKMNEKTKGQN
jgi:hypothetical protein